MREISVREMRSVLTSLEQILEEEGELTITRRGRKVARVVPMTLGRPVPSHRRLREAMPLQAVGSEALVRQDRDER
jgi:antitoxin (DNA-binding transcriptional repressor) of toxin-antitoxin stability system